jgi:hypothetical protein
VNYKYNRQYVCELLHNNYFGCEMNGQSEEQQESIEHAWIDEMDRRGWVLGDESIDDNNQFDNDAMASLVESHKLVLGEQSA